MARTMGNLLGLDRHMELFGGPHKELGLGSKVWKIHSVSIRSGPRNSLSSPAAVSILPSLTLWTTNSQLPGPRVILIGLCHLGSIHLSSPNQLNSDPQHPFPEMLSGISSLIRLSLISCNLPHIHLHLNLQQIHPKSCYCLLQSAVMSPPRKE